MVLKAAGNYTIHCKKQAIGDFKIWLKAQDYDRIAVLCDSNTAVHCFPKLELKLPLITIPADEVNKNINSLSTIWDALLQHGFTRKSLLINLGGGMVTDIGGFAASTFLRGIDFVNLPTSLLGMVDASVGGKTGIDYKDGKNLIGQFAFPKGLWVDPIFLETLPDRELASGKAEMIKHGLIHSKSHFEELKDINKPITTNQIFRSIQIKNTVVEKDSHEQGLRKTLNFGHTYGHALESYFLTTKTPLLHGEAIWHGMLWETLLSNRMGFLNTKETEIIVEIIKAHIPFKISLPSLNELLPWMQKDKKNTSNKIGFSLLEGIGQSKEEVLLSPPELLAQ